MGNVCGCACVCRSRASEIHRPLPTALHPARKALIPPPSATLPHPPTPTLRLPSPTPTTPLAAWPRRARRTTPPPTALTRGPRITRYTPLSPPLSARGRCWRSLGRFVAAVSGCSTTAGSRRTLGPPRGEAERRTRRGRDKWKQGQRRASC